MNNNINILQSIVVESRSKNKNKANIKSLFNLKTEREENIVKFRDLCIEDIYKQITEKTNLQPQVIKLYINTTSYSIVIVLNNIIIDPILDYYIPTKTFVMLIKEYPLKILEYKIIPYNIKKEEDINEKDNNEKDNNEKEKYN